MLEFPAVNGVSAKGLNKDLSVHLLEDKEMRASGFVNTGEKWLFMKRVGDRKYDISMDIVIPMNDPTQFRIDVIDEDFGQPYDYQNLIKSGSTCIPAFRVWIDVEEILQKLSERGIIVGHVFGAYV